VSCARMRTCAPPSCKVCGPLTARNPVTCMVPPGLHGVAVASSQAVSVSGSPLVTPCCVTSRVIELWSIWPMALATVNVNVGGLVASAFTLGFGLSTNGTPATWISATELIMFGTMVTGSGGLSKLGEAGRAVSHAAPTPGGSVAHTSVIPGGAGAKSVAKPLIMKVPAPLGSSLSNSERLPVESGGTLSGLTATQQPEPSSDSKTRRTVCTAFGNCVDAPPPGCCHIVCTPALPVPTGEVDPPPPLPPPPQAENRRRAAAAASAPIDLRRKLSSFANRPYTTLATRFASSVPSVWTPHTSNSPPETQSTM